VPPLEGLQAHAAPAEIAGSQRPSGDEGRLELPAWDGLQAALTGMPQQQHLVRALAWAATEPCASYSEWAHLFNYTCAIAPSATKSFMRRRMPWASVWRAGIILHGARIVIFGPDILLPGV